MYWVIERRDGLGRKRYVMQSKVNRSGKGTGPWYTYHRESAHRFASAQEAQNCRSYMGGVVCQVTEVEDFDHEHD